MAIPLLLACLLSAQPVLDAVPRLEPLDPPEALRSFVLRPGFAIELAAAEPDVADPVAFCFDAHGHLYVAEMRDYSERREERLGRIRRLSDSDGDGRYDRATVFADQLPWPTAVIASQEGLYVGASPDILFLRDADGDGRADTREVVFTGFGSDAPRLNVQQLLNSFAWGVDCRIHGASGGNGGRITCLKTGRRIDLRGRDFSFDPVTLDFRAETGGGQYGLALDDWGRKFVCSNSRHLMLVMYEESLSRRQTPFPLPPAAVDIPEDGPAAEVFRISPDEPWRVIRTRWRMAGVVPGIVEGGGRVSGYFTAATGITVYRGDQWPREHRGEVLVADAGSNLIHRKRIDWSRLPPVARRAHDEQRSEFLASRDNWFRPVQLGPGPDGALYIADMYREVIEHPWSIPEPLKSKLDLNRGNDRGRIYRVVSTTGRKKPARLPGDMKPEEWVGLLAHPNGWHQETAARLLYERNQRDQISRLQKAAAGAGPPEGRARALHLLAAWGAVDRELAERLLRDPEEEVRLVAFQLVARTPGLEAEASTSRLALLAKESPWAEFRTALLLQPTVQDDPVWTWLAERRFESAWMAEALLASSAGRALHRLGQLDLTRPAWAGEPGRAFLKRLFLAAEGEPGAPEQLPSRWKALSSPGLRLACAAGLQSEWSRQLLLDESWTAEARRLLADAPEELDRLEALRFLGREPARHRSLLVSMLDRKHSSRLQLAALEALSRSPSHDWVASALERWAQISPLARPSLLHPLVAREDRALALLASIRAGRLAAAEIPALQRRQLLEHASRAVREEAARLFPSSAHATASERLQQHLRAVELEGNAARGSALFEERCASCHARGGIGKAVGPDLLPSLAAGKLNLLAGILDPNREVNPLYAATTVTTRAGETEQGILKQDTADWLVLLQAGGLERRIPRGEALQVETGARSLMPEGLADGLTDQDLADLLEFLISP